MKAIESFSVPPTHSWLFDVAVMMADWWWVGYEFNPYKGLFDFNFYVI